MRYWTLAALTAATLFPLAPAHAEVLRGVIKDARQEDGAVEVDVPGYRSFALNLDVYVYQTEPAYTPNGKKKLAKLMDQWAALQGAQVELQGVYEEEDDEDKTFTPDPKQPIVVQGRAMASEGKVVDAIDSLDYSVPGGGAIKVAFASRAPAEGEEIRAQGDFRGTGSVLQVTRWSPLPAGKDRPAPPAPARPVPPRPAAGQPHASGR